MSQRHQPSSSTAALESGKYDYLVNGWVGLLPVYALFLCTVWLFRYYQVDDVFITFRFVQQWVHGNGLVYNVGDYVEGYSNFLWILALAPFERFGIDLLTAAKYLGIVCSAGTLYVTWQTGRLFGAAIIAPLFLAAAAPFAAWSASGLETALFTFLLALSSLLFINEERRQKGVLSGLTFALLALTRPEGIIFGVIAVLLRALTLWKERSWPKKRDWIRGLILVVIVGAYYVWRWNYYGHLLPNTVYAKSMGGHVRAYLEGVYYVFGGLKLVGGFAILAIPFAFLLTDRPFGMQTVYLTSVCAVATAFIIVAGGDWMPLQRFTVHVLPQVFVLVGGGLVLLGRHWNRPAIYWVMAILVVGQTLYLLMSAVELRYIDHVASPPQGQSQMMSYIQRHVDVDEPIAVVDAGAIAYNLPLEVRVIDMVGLTDEHIAHRPPQFPGGIFGRGDAFGKWDVDYVLAQKPQLVQVHLGRRDDDGRWRTNFTGTTLLVNHPDFQSSYRLVDEPGVTSLFERIGP